MRKSFVALTPKALLAGFAAVAAVLLGGGAPDPQGFIRVTPAELTWSIMPDSLGVEGASVIGDPNKPGAYVIRARFPPHVMDRPHTHSGGDRIVTVLEGQWCTGTGPVFDPAKAVRLGPGSVMKHPSGAVHWDGSCTDRSVVVQIAGEGIADTKPIEPKSPLWVDVSAMMAHR